MKTLILILLLTLLISPNSWGEEEFENFYVKDTSHKVLFQGILTFKDYVELEYCDLIMGEPNWAFEKWLKTISAKEFLDKYCIIIYSDISEVRNENPNLNPNNPDR